MRGVPLGTSGRDAELLAPEYDFIFLHDPQSDAIADLRNGAAGTRVFARVGFEIVSVSLTGRAIAVAPV